MLLVLVVVFVSVTRFRGTSALEKWKRELESRGEKLSIADLAPARGLLDDTNLNELRLAAGRLETRAITPAYLGPLTFTAPGRAQPAWAEPQIQTGLAKTSSWAVVGVEMEAAREDLDRIGATLIDPEAISNFDYRDPNVVINKIGERIAAQWLSGATLYELHEGYLARAQQRLHALIQLMRLHRDEPLLVTQMMRVAIAGLALDVTWAALQVPGWNEASLSGLQRNWETTQFLEKFALSMKMQRAGGAGLFADARTNGFKSVRSRVTWGPVPPRSWETILREHILEPTWRLAWSGSDELYYWQSMQPGLEALQRAVRHKSFRRLQVELAGTAYNSTAALTGYDSIRFQLSQLLKANFTRAHEHVMRAEALRNLTVVAIALRRYQLRYGRLAPNLDALVPEFVQSVPVDYMDGQSIRYRREVDGGFRLYSVGLDSQDDGGDPGPAAPWTRYSMIWDGRDVVWPERGAVEQEAATPVDVLPLIQFEDVALSDAIKVLVRQAQLNVAFDRKIDLAAYSRVSLHLENVSAKDVLQAVLANNNLVMFEHPGTNLVGITRK
jgi:hypothetical protein